MPHLFSRTFEELLSHLLLGFLPVIVRKVGQFLWCVKSLLLEMNYTSLSGCAEAQCQPLTRGNEGEWEDNTCNRILRCTCFRFCCRVSAARIRELPPTTWNVQKNLQVWGIKEFLTKQPCLGYQCTISLL
jgi:hypothetical protein